MSQSNSEMHLTRRAALALGGGTAAGLLLPGGTTALAAAKGGGLLRQSGRLPSLKDLEGILHAEGELVARVHRVSEDFRGLRQQVRVLHHPQAARRAAIAHHR